MEKKNLFLILLSILINFITSQMYDYKIGDILSEEIVNQRYYKIELTDRDSEYLIVNVKPSDNYEKYSDPDIFVSQVN